MSHMCLAIAHPAPAAQSTAGTPASLVTRACLALTPQAPKSTTCCWCSLASLPNPCHMCTSGSYAVMHQAPTNTTRCWRTMARLPNPCCALVSGSITPSPNRQPAACGFLQACSTHVMRACLTLAHLAHTSSSRCWRAMASLPDPRHACVSGSCTHGHNKRYLLPACHGKPAKPMSHACLALTHPAPTNATTR